MEGQGRCPDLRLGSRGGGDERECAGLATSGVKEDGGRRKGEGRRGPAALAMAIWLVVGRHACGGGSRGGVEARQ